MSISLKLLRSFLLIFLVIILNSTSSRAVQVSGSAEPKPFIITGRVTIQFEADVATDKFQTSFAQASFNIPSLDALMDQFGVTGAEAVFPWRTERPAVNSKMYDLTRYWEIFFPETVDVNAVIKALIQNPHVRSAEAVWALPIDASPNDPSWISQWYMHPPGPDPHFYDAWDKETGSDSIIFACVDVGVCYRHPDLAGNIWVNPGEDLDSDGVVYDPDDLNGVDDDFNGRTDDLIGYDFFTGFGGGLGIWPGEDGSSIDTDPNDFNGHGTHVSGIAAAMNNNATGVTGAAGGWYGGNRAFRGVRIMCCRVGATANDGFGYVNSDNCGSAIDYAAMMHASVINCSWGSQATGTMIAGMNNATASGVSVFHAAGNANLDSPDYLDLLGTRVMSVAATTSSDHKAGFSNYGTWVDVSAPGDIIWNTYSNMYSPTYNTLSGTSMASPCAGGEALLIKSMMPSLARSTVDSLIIATADNIDALNPSFAGQLGSGRINANTALSLLANAKFSADVTEGTAPLTVHFTDMSPNSPVSWDWTFGTGDGSTDQNPIYIYNNPGIYTVDLKENENNAFGLGEERLKNYIWVRNDALQIDSVFGVKGTTKVVPVRLTNTSLTKQVKFAFTMTATSGITLDSFNLVGARTAYFDEGKFLVKNPSFYKWVISLRPDTGAGSTYLTSGSGVILNLRFAIDLSAPSGFITIDTQTVSGIKTTVSSIWGDYFPNTYHAGKLLVGCTYGDANCDGTVANILDLTYVVDYVFRGGPPTDLVGGDVNGDSFRNILDLTYLVDRIFRSGPPPPPPPP